MSHNDPLNDCAARTAVNLAGEMPLDFQEQARLIGRACIASQKNQKGACSSAELVLSGKWDDVTEVRHSIRAAFVTLLISQKL